MASSPEQSRIAESADSEEVADLLDRFQAEFDEHTPGAEVLAPRVREHIAGELSVFCWPGRRTSAWPSCAREYLLTGAPTCYLEELYVVPDRRGEGHGRMLMQTALGLARQRGATTIELGTAVNDAAARGLYESLGFTNLEKQGKPETQMLSYERELWALWESALARWIRSAGAASENSRRTQAAHRAVAVGQASSRAEDHPPPPRR